MTTVAWRFGYFFAALFFIALGFSSSALFNLAKQLFLAGKHINGWMSRFAVHVDGNSEGIYFCSLYVARFLSLGKTAFGIIEYISIHMAVSSMEI
jgi:hypothetical protein